MRVLLAEDNARLASLIAAGLGDEGFTVDTAGTLAKASAALATGGHDLVLLDLGMPDGDGVAFICEARRMGLTTPILVITARDGPNDRVLGLDSGADDYVVKPVDLPELAARCRALLRRPGACRRRAGRGAATRARSARAVDAPCRPRRHQAGAGRRAVRIVCRSHAQRA